jgi:deazaflavin-dependent oxidoreductase (nitroreductase family)
MNDHRGSLRLDLRNRMAGRFLRLANPLARRMISAGLPTGAPNVLLTTCGRRSGKLRTVPLGLLEMDGRRFVQASYGELGWVANLRASAEATLTHPGGHPTSVQAVELPVAEGAAVLQRALQPFGRSRLLGAALCLMLGPRFRPPVGVFLTLGVRVDDTLEQYVADVRRHPVFELRRA